MEGYGREGEGTVRGGLYSIHYTVRLNRQKREEDEKEDGRIPGCFL